MFEVSSHFSGGTAADGPKWGCGRAVFSESLFYPSELVPSILKGHWTRGATGLLMVPWHRLLPEEWVHRPCDGLSVLVSQGLKSNYSWSGY